MSRIVGLEDVEVAVAAAAAVAAAILAAAERTHQLAGVLSQSVGHDGNQCVRTTCRGISYRVT